MTLPPNMTCIEISAPGGPEVLEPALRPLPAPKPGEVLVKVAAAGVNRPDVVQRQGLYPPPPGASDIPGLEIAGTVVAHGEGVSAPALGSKVCALVAGGGYAEYATAPAVCCLPVPAPLSLTEAAAIPETFFTVWHNVFERGALQRGETFLVHGGASGIGTTAIQLAKAFGARAIATAGSAEKCEACVALGADMAINYRTHDFAEVIKADTHGVDVILDMVGGDYTGRNLKCLKPDGRLVQIAFLKGPKAEIDMLPVMVKRLTVTGSTLRPRDVAFKGRLAAALRDKVWPLLEAKTISPRMDRVFPLIQAAEAHRHLESGGHVGKIVLNIS
ncbi:MAG: NAD(P)H-quinone oxidoreductase [Rhodospirillaceae bacterium]|nr:NAD(P)H-quinone oxidoreductase [Rhodospirillaceae bacterium]